METCLAGIQRSVRASAKCGGIRSSQQRRGLTIEALDEAKGGIFYSYPVIRIPS